MAISHARAFACGRPVSAAAATLWTVLAVAPASGQTDAPADTVRPGDPRVDVSSVPPYRITWIVYAVSEDGERTRVAVWTDSERPVVVGERALTRFESSVRYANGRERHDIVHWDPVTRVPASVELRGYNDRGGWAFIGYEQGRAVTVYRGSPAEDARWVLEELGQPAFSVGDGGALLLRRPMEVGMEFVYPYHDRANGGIRYMEVRVVGREPVPGFEERWPGAWVVENSAGWKSWYLKKLPYVARLEVPRRGGGTDVWVFEEMEELEELEEGGSSR